MIFLTKHEINFIVHGFCPSPIIMGDLIWKFTKISWGQNFFLHLWGNKYLWEGELKIYGGSIFITTLSLFHFFRNSQHPEKWRVLLRVYLGNVNVSVVTCQYPQIYYRNPLEKLYLLCLLWQVLWKKSVLLATYLKLLLK